MFKILPVEVTKKDDGLFVFSASRLKYLYVNFEKKRKTFVGLCKELG